MHNTHIVIANEVKQSHNMPIKEEIATAAEGRLAMTVFLKARLPRHPGDASNDQIANYAKLSFFTHGIAAEEGSSPILTTPLITAPVDQFSRRVHNTLDLVHSLLLPYANAELAVPATDAYPCLTKKCRDLQKPHQVWLGMGLLSCLAFLSSYFSIKSGWFLLSHS